MENEIAKAQPRDQQWHVLGRAGLWKQAAANLRQGIESDPNNPVPYFLLAPTLLATGDVDGYRQLCQRIVAQFHGTRDAGDADKLAKACLIHPGPGVSLDVVAQLAATAVTQGQNSEYLPWFQLCKALAEYRQGHFANAVNWANKALGSAAALPVRDAAAEFVLAMAHQQLNETGAARLSLDKATKIVDRKLSKLDSGDLGPQWVDRIVADILMREAKGLIEPRPPGEKN